MDADSRPDWFNSSKQVGGSLGHLAIPSTLAAARTSNLIAQGATSEVARVAATVSGYHVAFLAAAAMLGTGAVLMVTLLRRRHLEGVEIDPAALPAVA